MEEAGKFYLTSPGAEVPVAIFYHGKKRWIVIPKRFADLLDLKNEMTFLKARLANGEIILKPVRKRPTLEAR